MKTTLLELEQKLREDVIAARAAGRKLVRGHFGNTELAECCLIEAFDDHSGQRADRISAAAEHYDLETEEVWALLYGFDRRPVHRSIYQYVQLNLLGHKLSEELQPE